jgi:hypothetical protein
LNEKTKPETTDHGHGGPEQVPINIDHKPYKVQAGPTTGAQLRALPPVPADRDLWLERKGDDEKILPETVLDIRHHLDFYTAPSTINPGGHG